MTTILVDHVTKTFDEDRSTGLPGITALDDITLKVPSGDVLGVIGPSGCGKSTLLRLVAGLIQPDKGQILYNNENLQTVRITERGIGMVFQNGALIPHWGARRSVGFFLSLRNREHEVPERLYRISKITGIGLEQLLARRPSHLSGGEQQRVSIARALARDLKVLLFDEPFANIDAKLRSESRQELKRLMQEFPVAAIYVTHDQAEAATLSHRIAVMREGKVEQTGTYHQLYDNPVNKFAATFIGTPTINLFDGRVQDGKWQGENFGGFPIRTDLPDGAPVTLGIRPTHVMLQSGGTPAVIDSVMPFYAERFQQVDVHLAGEHWALTVPLDEKVQVGETIYCVLNPEGILYFDGKTDIRIG